MLLIKAENRIMDVTKENRFVAIPKENRFVAIPKCHDGGGVNDKKS